MDLYDGPEEKALLVQIDVSMITLEECFHFIVLALTLLDDASEEGQQDFLLKKKKFIEKREKKIVTKSSPAQFLPHWTLPHTGQTTYIIIKLFQCLNQYQR